MPSYFRGPNGSICRSEELQGVPPSLSSARPRTRPTTRPVDHGPPSAQHQPQMSRRTTKRIYKWLEHTPGQGERKVVHENNLIAINRVASTAVSLAVVVLLSSKEGFYALTLEGKILDGTWKQDDHIYRQNPYLTPEKSMNECVNLFLNRMEDEEFLYLSFKDRLEKPAFFQPEQWYNPDTMRGLDDWHPRAAGILVIDRAAAREVAHYDEARNSDGDPNRQYYEQEYNRVLFRLAAAIAKELVKCFIGYMTGTSREYFIRCRSSAKTGWGDNWEKFVLGGAITSDEKGALFSVNIEGNWRPISAEAIRRAMHRDFRLLPPHSRPPPRANMRPGEGMPSQGSSAALGRGPPLPRLITSGSGLSSGSSNSPSPASTLSPSQSISSRGGRTLNSPAQSNSAGLPPRWPLTHRTTVPAPSSASSGSPYSAASSASSEIIVRRIEGLPRRGLLLDNPRLRHTRD